MHVLNSKHLTLMLYTRVHTADDVDVYTNYNKCSNHSSVICQEAASPFSRRRVHWEGILNSPAAGGERCGMHLA